jgi:glutathione S-transferase
MDAWQTFVRRRGGKRIEVGMKLYRFHYSPYARKVQMVLDLLGARYDLIEVSYGERNELAALTGGYIHVPVLQLDDGEVLVESRAICQRMVADDPVRRLVPSGLDGPVWAYCDFLDGPVEDVLFRIASPAVRDTWTSPWERALYTLIKERKFGAGCIDLWRDQRESLIARAHELLAATGRTLDASPFVFGATVSLADAGLYGLSAMLECAGDALSRIDPRLVAHARRVEAAAARARS